MAITPTSLSTSITTSDTTIVPNTNIVHDAVNQLTAAANGAAFNLKSQSGIVGNGVADDTAAINAAVASAASLGVPLYGAGTYKITSTVTLTGPADLSAATFNYTGTGVAVQVGGATALTWQAVKLPKIVYTPKTGTGWTAGTVGVKAINTQTCDISFNRISGFETGLWVFGNAAGNAWSTYRLGHLDNNKINLLISADSTGFSNQNTYVGGRLSHNSGEGSQVSGTRQVVFSNSTNIHNAHLFSGTSFESPDVVEYHIECYGQYNRFVGCRFENTGGDTHRRVYSRGSAKGNVFQGGFNAGQLTQVLSDTARQFDIESDVSTTRVGGTSTAEVLRLENANSSTAPTLVIMEAGASAAATDPTTGYAVKATAQKWSGKRAADSFDRLQMDYLNGRVYVGDATAAPTGYIGGSTSTVFVGGGLPFIPLANNTQDCGISSLKWRYIRAGTAIQTGAAVTGSRPAASTAAAGAMFYDTTLSKPIWSDGTTWRDATGTAV